MTFWNDHCRPNSFNLWSGWARSAWTSRSRGGAWKKWTERRERWKRRTWRTRTEGNLLYYVTWKSV